MPSDSEESGSLSATDALIDRIIKEAFASLTAELWAHLQTDYGFERVETESGPAVRFTVPSNIGAMQCLYHLKPAVKLLLEKHPIQESGPIAVPILQRLLCDLPLAAQIGMENALDSAELAAVDTLEAILSVADPSINRDARKRRTETLKVMNARNAVLVEPPKSGPEPEVSLDRLCAAVNFLRREGWQVDQITAMALANKLGCEENSVYQALNRHGTSLKDFLSRFKPGV